MDAVVDGVLKSAPDPQWLEDYVLGEFRAWQIILLAFTAFITTTIALCCCIKFRIPRTKQQIEADYQRRIITKKFREQLERIQNSDMDAMDLKAALDIIRADFDNVSEKDNDQSASLISSIGSRAPSSEENSQLDGKLPAVFNFSNIVALVRKNKQKNNDMC